MGMAFEDRLNTFGSNTFLGGDLVSCGGVELICVRMTTFIYPVLSPLASSSYI